MVRFKNRWIIAEFIFEDNLPGCNRTSKPISTSIDSRHILQSIRRNISVHFGDLGAASVANSLSLKYYSANTRLGIFRVARNCKDVLQATLTLTTSLSNHPVIIRVIHVSGTIRKVQEAAIKYDRQIILNSFTSNDLDEEMQLSKNGIMSIES